MFNLVKLGESRFQNFLGIYKTVIKYTLSPLNINKDIDSAS